eukprot:Gb_20845 [translate_table: standard]
MQLSPSNLPELPLVGCFSTIIIKMEALPKSIRRLQQYLDEFERDRKEIMRSIFGHPPQSPKDHREEGEMAKKRRVDTQIKMPNTPAKQIINSPEEKPQKQGKPRAKKTVNVDASNVNTFKAKYKEKLRDLLNLEFMPDARKKVLLRLLGIEIEPNKKLYEIDYDAMDDETILKVKDWVICSIKSRHRNYLAPRPHCQYEIRLQLADGNAHQHDNQSKEDDHHDQGHNNKGNELEEHRHVKPSPATKNTAPPPSPRHQVEDKGKRPMGVERKRELFQIFSNNFVNGPMEISDDFIRFMIWKKIGRIVDDEFQVEDFEDIDDDTMREMEKWIGED